MMRVLDYEMKEVGEELLDRCLVITELAYHIDKEGQIVEGVNDLAR